MFKSLNSKPVSNILHIRQPFQKNTFCCIIRYGLDMDVRGNKWNETFDLGFASLIQAFQTWEPSKTFSVWFNQTNLTNLLFFYLVPNVSFQALRDSTGGFGWNINPYFCHCYCRSRWQLLLVRHQHITYLQKVLSFIISFFLFSFTFTKDKRKNVIWSFIFCKTAHLWTLCEALIICHCNYECKLSNMPFQRKSCGGNCVQYVLIKQLVCNAVSTTCL